MGGVRESLRDKLNEWEDDMVWKEREKRISQGVIDIRLPTIHEENGNGMIQIEENTTIWRTGWDLANVSLWLILDEAGGAEIPYVEPDLELCGEMK